MDEERKTKITHWTLNVLLIVLLIIGIYLLVTRVLGHSPTDFQIILYLFSFYGIAILKIFTLIYSLNRELGEIKINIKNGFNKMKNERRGKGN